MLQVAMALLVAITVLSVLDLSYNVLNGTRFGGVLCHRSMETTWILQRLCKFQTDEVLAVPAKEVLL